MSTEYTKIDDDTLGQVNVISISVSDLLSQKKMGQDMIDEGKRIVDDAEAKLQKASDLGIDISASL